MTERELYDSATRMQAYAEGVKAGLVAIFAPYSRSLVADLRAALSGLDVDNIGELTKKKLNSLIADLRKMQQGHYSAYEAELLAQLEAFMDAALRVTFEVYKEDDSEIIPAALLWGKLSNDYIPATGTQLAAFVASVGLVTIAQVEADIRKAWANNEAKSILLSKIAGKATKQGRSTSMHMADIRAQAVAETSGQYVYQYAFSEVVAAIVGRYRWCSVMDSRTTDICRSRNGKIFEYGKGPLPPAHIRCRSHIAPSIGGKIEQEAFPEWLGKQPKELQGELARKAKGEKMSVDDFLGVVDKVKAR